MITGYDKPLHILPFDHRHSFITGVFHWQEPLTPGQVADIVASKGVIYDGFKAAVVDSAERGRAGILVDEAFGAAVLRDAAIRGYITCVSTEKSGQDEFDFEYGDGFASHIETVNPTFAKVLVRYNPEGDAGMNARQVERLRQLSDYLARTRRLFMFELLGAAGTRATRSPGRQPRGVRSRAASGADDRHDSRASGRRGRAGCLENRGTRSP